MPELRRSFDKVLGITGICPENSLYYVAVGAAELASVATPLGSHAGDSKMAHPGMTISGLIGAIKTRKTLRCIHPRAQAV